MTALPDTMRAVMMTRTGGPEVLEVQQVQTPQPRQGEITVRVGAVSVNRTLDVSVRNGTYARMPSLPHVPGVDPSGTVAAVGVGVDEVSVGDRVALSSRVGQTPDGRIVMLGLDCWGGYAEYVRVPANAAFRIPDALDFATATAVMRHMPQALHMLRDKAGIKAGDTVLVMGATGGLGSASVQVARHLGAHVIVGAGADGRVKSAIEAGGAAGVNYRSQDLTKEVLALTEGRGVDIVCENIGEPELFAQAFACLARNGRLVTVGSHGGGVVPLDIRRLYMNQNAVIGSTGVEPQDVLDSFEIAVATGYRPQVAATFALEQAGEAQAMAVDGATLGKVMLDPALKG